MLQLQGTDCEFKKEMEDMVIGVIDVRDIREVTKIEDINKSLRFINEYNKALQNQKKRVRKINS